MYAAKRDYAEKIVSGWIYPIKEGLAAQFGIYVVNDGLLPITGVATVDVRRWSDAAIVAHYDTAYRTQALGAAPVWTTTVGALLNASCAPTDCFVCLTATWSDGAHDGVITNVVYPTSLKAVELPMPAVTVLMGLGDPQVDCPWKVSADTGDSPDGANLFTTSLATGVRRGSAATVTQACSSTYASLEQPLLDSIMDDFPLASAAARVSRALPPRTAFALTVQVNATSPYTWLETHIAGRWSDNGVFVVGGTQANLTFTAEEPVDPQQFLSSLHIRTLYATYHRP